MTIRDDLKAAFEQWDTLLGEINHSRDRIAAIAAAAFFDDLLASAIEIKFVPLSNTVHDRIFDGNGPLSPFSAKIDIAYALGLYPAEIKTDLHKVRKVRNLFAHSAGPITFDHQDVVKLTSVLTTPTKKSPVSDVFGVTTSRGRYLTTIWHARHLLNEATFTP